MAYRYVGVKKGDLWVGTCLELGIVVVAENIDELKKEMWQGKGKMNLIDAHVTKVINKRRVSALVAQVAKAE